MDSKIELYKGKHLYKKHFLVTLRQIFDEDVTEKGIFVALNDNQKFSNWMTIKLKTSKIGLQFL